MKTPPLPSPLLAPASRREGAGSGVARGERASNGVAHFHSLSSIRNGGEGRGEEALGFRISPLPARSSRGEGKELRAPWRASWLAVNHEPPIICA